MAWNQKTICLLQSHTAANDFRRSATVNDFRRSAAANDFRRSAAANDFRRNATANNFRRSATGGEVIREIFLGLCKPEMKMTCTQLLFEEVC